MSLRDILQNLADGDNPVLVNSNHIASEAAVLLQTLPEPWLKKRAHLQPGMYIAEINEQGYLGTVLYRYK